MGRGSARKNGNMSFLTVSICRFRKKVKEKNQNEQKINDTRICKEGGEQMNTLSIVLAIVGIFFGAVSFGYSLRGLAESAKRDRNDESSQANKN